MNDNGTLLEIRDLRTHFFTEEGVARAVDGVSWSLDRGKTLALVGESGCGKSVTALSIMRLIASPPGRIVSGSIFFDGIELTKLAERRMRSIRGNRIAMIFQEPMTSLNPVYTIGDQIVEAVELHQNLRGKDAWNLAVETLRKVGISAPEQRAHEYPHQMSGGMRQRVMIAMALSCNPDLLIADEPTTALDVTIQAQILDLLRKLQEDTGMSILIITHDLGVVAETAHDVCVMYAGRIVEQADVNELFASPIHPYTRGLLRCMPRLADAKARLEVIPGNVPNPLHFPRGCKFHPRCRLTAENARQPDRKTAALQVLDGQTQVLQRCIANTPDETGGEPDLREVKPNHWAACWEVDADNPAKTDRRTPMQ